jgi:type II secretory pathway component PulJ
MTLIEVLIATAIGTFVVMTLVQLYESSRIAREEVIALAEPMSTGPMVMDMIEEDLQSLWLYNVKEDDVLKGENKDIVGIESDRIYLLVAGPTLDTVRLDDDSETSWHMAEVSYKLRANPDNPDLLELWRSEKPMMELKRWEGGSHQLLSNRIRSFNVRYYTDLGKEAEPLEEWSSTEESKLPRRIEIEMVLERKAETFNVLSGVEVEDIGGRTIKFVRHIVLPSDYAEILGDEMALLPSIPDEAPGLEGGAAGGGAASGLAGGGTTNSSSTSTEGGAGPGAGAMRGDGKTPTKTGTTPKLPTTGGNVGNIGDLLKRIGGQTGGGR